MLAYLAGYSGEGDRDWASAIGNPGGEAFAGTIITASRRGGPTTREVVPRGKVFPTTAPGSPRGQHGVWTSSPPATSWTATSTLSSEHR